LNRKILDLAIPNIISNITIPLLSIVDLAVLGHLESEVYIGAIAIGGIIFNFIYWGFGFWRMGTVGLTAQAHGAGNHGESMLILSRALLVAFASALLIIILQVPIAMVSFWMIEGSQEVENLASSYYYIRIYAAPASIGLYAFTGWFLGMQNARYPMIIAIVVNVLNIGFNLFFVMQLGLKSDGVALGTVLSQYLGLILALILFLKKYKSYLARWTYRGMVQIKALKEFFLVNSDIMIRTILLLMTFAYFTSESARINDTILAINTLLLQFLFIFSYFIDGYANAAEALIGKYTGARDKSNLRKAINLIFRWGIFISIPFSAAYLLAGNQLLKILTNNKELILLASEYLPWVALLPVLSFAAFIWDGVYIGATATKAMRNSMIFCSLAVFMPIIIFGQTYFGNHALWIAMLAFMLSRGVLLTFLSKRSIYSKMKL